MKKLSVFVLVLVLFVGNLAYADLNDGLVAYYPFNGNANDESGNGYNGTVDGATLTADRFSDPNSAYYFDGNDDYINIGDINEIDGATILSISLWLNTNATDRRRSILTKWIEKTSGNTGAWWMELGNDEIDSGCIAGPINFWETDDAGLVIDNWYHIALVFDGSQTGNENRYKIYVNGTQKTVNFGSDVPNQLGDEGDQEANIGSYENGDGLFFYGEIDDIRIYDRSLSENEIQQLFGMSNSIPTLAEWGMIIFFILLVGSALWVKRRRIIRERCSLF